MLSRIRIALGLALLLSLITFVSVFAKGQFSFITVTGGQLTQEVRLSDPALTQDFFAFADFYRNRAESPVDPGLGYEITRYYINGHTETAFDRLHYYPETGFVYYDGIVGGSSEYDGKWYTAKDMQKTFESALNTQIRLMRLGTQAGSSMMVPPDKRVQAFAQAQTGPTIPQTRSILSIMAVGGLAIIIAVGLLRSRKLSPR